MGLRGYERSRGLVSNGLGVVESTILKVQRSMGLWVQGSKGLGVQGTRCVSG
jgi:hypothetical protein